MRFAGRVLAVLLFLLLARIQRDDDMRHQVFGAGEYAPLWTAGIAACVISIAAVLLILMVLR
jgi:hypothetical protein